MSTQYNPLFEILAGGPGSGCNPAVGKCGRPSMQQTKKEVTLANGAKYTIFQPSRKGMPRRASGYTKPSAFKGKFGTQQDTQTGKFRRVQDVPGLEGRDKRLSAIYNAKWGKKDVWANKGECVIVQRDFANSRVVIHSFYTDSSTGRPELISQKQWKFKNFGTAAGFLNQKWGIRQKLPVRKLPATDTQKRELTKKYSRTR